MFNWSILVPMLINVLLVSVPEEAFFVVTSLILMKRYDLLKLNKTNITKMLIVVLPVAVLLNILRSFAGFQMDYSIFIAFLGVFIPMVVIYRYKSLYGIAKVFLSVALSLIFAVSIQLLYFPFVFYGTSITIEELNQYSSLSLIISIIDRVLQIGIVAFLFLKKNELIKLNIFKMLKRNRAFSIVTGIMILIDFGFVYIMCILVYYQKILLHLSPYMQLIVIVAIVLFPILNLSAIIGITNVLVNKDTKTKTYFKDEYRVLKVLLNILINQQDYGRIKGELEVFEAEVIKITK